jgi:hypothetical protein
VPPTTTTTVPPTTTTTAAPTLTQPAPGTSSCVPGYAGCSGGGLNGGAGVHPITAPQSATPLAASTTAAQTPLAFTGSNVGLEGAFGGVLILAGITACVLARHLHRSA